MKIKAKHNQSNIDMLTGSLPVNILLFTLPIALSSMLQQLFNAADTSIVGYFGNSNALAAVGTNGEIVALIVTLSSGLAIGVNVIIANRIGLGKTEDISEIVQTSVILAVIVGLISLAIGEGITLPLLRLIKTPDKILTLAEMYLRIYLLGYPFLLLYDFGAAILRARGDSRYPFIALVISGIANILFNLLFVIVLHLDVAGVAIATDISTALSACMVLHRLKKDEIFKLSLKHPQIKIEYIGKILGIGTPSAIQGAVFCFANIFVQASVNTFGPVAIAGSTIAMNFEYFTYYVITAFGQTATTFTSQNYAARNYKRCKKILLLSVIFSLICCLIMIVPIVVFRDFFSGLFSTDASVIQSAGIRIMCILAFEPICCLYEIPAGSLRGLGHSLLPAISTMIGTCAFRIIWICTVFHMHQSLEVLYHAFPLSWVATILLISISFIIVNHIDHRH